MAIQPRHRSRSTSTTRDRVRPSELDDTASDAEFRVLVIDDSPTVLRAVKRAFGPSDCQIDTVGHYLEIPRYLRLTPPDLVILDLAMPGLSGERVAEFIRRDQRRETPIFIYSSSPDESLQAAASRIHAVGWLSKQAPLGRLVEIVHTILRRVGA